MKSRRYIQKCVNLCWISAATVCALAAGSSAASTTVSFPANGLHPDVEYYSSDRPVAVAMGDFNKDGKLDLAVANYYGGNVGGHVSVLLGKGNGSFLSPVSYYSGALSTAVAVGDFDHDGNLDLVVANQNSADVTIFMGNGDGTFKLGVPYAAGFQPTSIAIADFNGDGKADLAITDATNGVIVLAGKGNGTFETATRISMGKNPSSVVAGDFNGDGKVDIAVSNHGYNGDPGSTIEVLLGKGDGTFLAPVSYQVGNSPRYVNVGDFNKDGKLDLVVANDLIYPFGGGAVLLGKGDGTFGKALPYLAASFPFAVAVGDFNHDGKPDLAVANHGQGGCGDNVSMLMGKGDGTFSAAVNFDAGIAPSAIVVGDLNGDKNDDLVVANQGSNTVSIFMGKSASEQASGSSQSVPPNGGCWARNTQPGSGPLR